MSTTIRVSQSADVVSIARTAATDPRLSFGARGMLFTMISAGDGVELDLAYLQESGGVKLHAVRRMLGELEAAGYVHRSPIKGRGRIDWKRTVSDVPSMEIQPAEKPSTVKPSTGRPSTENPPMAPSVNAAWRPVAALPPTRDVLSPPSEPFTNVQGSVPGSDANASSPGRSAATARRARATAESRPKAPPKVDPAYHDRFAMIRDAAELHPKTITPGDARAVADAAKALAPMSADELRPMLARAGRIIRERFAFKGTAAAAPTPAQLRGEVGRMLLAKGIQRPGEGVTIDLRIYHPDGKRRDFVDACGKWPCDRYGEPDEWPTEIRAAFPDRAAQWQADADAQKARVAAMREADHALV